MDVPGFFGRFAAREMVDPAATRALRATAAMMIPLVLGALGLVTDTQAVLAAFAGHALSLLDVRGAYALRLSLLFAVALVFSGAAWLGVEAGRSVALAVLATGLVALGAGAWRHGLGEYGPSVASSAALLFFIALGSPKAAHASLSAAGAALAGGLLCILGHAVSWPFLAQHPLRRAVARSWTALADLAEALPAMAGVSAAQRRERVGACEHSLRTALDEANQALAGARAATSRPLVKELEALNAAAAELATQFMAFDPILERLLEGPGPGPLAAAFRGALASLVNTSRSLALAVVSHQSGHLTRFEVRSRRLDHMLKVLRDRVASRSGGTPEGVHLVAVADAILARLPGSREHLRASMERAQERGPVSFELFDLKAWTLRPLATALNFSLQVDPALVRFTFRLAVLMMAGTYAYRAWHLPHGYWMPLCVIIVLQPDYGATRTKATQRAVGTVAGALAGGLLLLLDPPLWALLAATAAVCWAFTFYLKRDYAVAVFFITVMVVLQFQAAGPVTLALTLQRLALTMAGCFMALLAALSFWPMWERDRFPPLLAQALRANRDFLDRLAQGLGGDPAVTPRTVLKAKRQAQRANSVVFSSLNRMAGDPDVMREGIELNAALANHNLRITRGLSVAAVHFRAEGGALEGVAGWARPLGEALEALAGVVEGGNKASLAGPRAALEASRLPEASDPRDAFVLAQLEGAATELSATLLEFD